MTDKDSSSCRFKAVIADYRKALYWYQKADEQGNLKARENLAKLKILLQLTDY